MAKERFLKIGLVLDDSLDKPDGVQQYVLAVGQWLAKEGHDVHYLVGQTTRTDIANVHSLSRNLTVRFNGNRMSPPLPTGRRALKALLDREQYDILHVQMPYSPWLAHRLIQAAGPRTAVIGTFHIVAYSRLAQLATHGLAVWTRHTTRRFDRVFSVSTAAADYATKTYGLATTVLPNVIDYQRFHLAKPLRRSSNALHLLFLGRLVPRKGCQLLLAAVAVLAATRPNVPDFKVLICGKGPLAKELKDYAKRHGITNLVEFVGFVSETDKPRYYASADIAVFPSSGGESFGIVLLEAMASGKAAVLAGDNSGYRSVLHERAALLFDPKDAMALAAKIKTYLIDADARRAAAAWGESYSQRFDTAVVGTKLVQAYHQALQKRRSP